MLYARLNVDKIAFFFTYQFLFSCSVGTGCIIVTGYQVDATCKAL